MRAYSTNSQIVKAIVFVSDVVMLSGSSYNASGEMSEFTAESC